MMSPEIIATIIAIAFGILASIIGVYIQLNAKVSVIDEKIAQLEEQGRIFLAIFLRNLHILPNSIIVLSHDVLSMYIGVYIDICFELLLCIKNGQSMTI